MSLPRVTASSVRSTSQERPSSCSTALMASWPTLLSKRSDAPDRASRHCWQICHDYEAFGKVYGTPTENLTQPFRFTGRAWDPETELYYYRRRNYEVDIGRFLGRDPVVSMKISVYVYARNAPPSYTDPLGLLETQSPGDFQVTWSPHDFDTQVIQVVVDYRPTAEQAKKCKEIKLIQFVKYYEAWWLSSKWYPWALDPWDRYKPEKPPGWVGPVQPAPFYPYQKPWRKDWPGPVTEASPRSAWLEDSPGWPGRRWDPRFGGGLIYGITCAVCTKCELSGQILGCVDWSASLGGAVWRHSPERNESPKPSFLVPPEVLQRLQDLGFAYPK